MRSRIRTSADQCLFAAPRSFSQLITSFFGACCNSRKSRRFSPPGEKRPISAEASRG